MPKQLNIDLNFTANTSQVKAEMQDLQNSLAKLTMTAQSKSPLGLTKEVNSAIGEVTKLQAVLQKSTTSTGKLDLGQFHNELNKANLDAQKIGKTLLGLGPEGQAAFSKLAQSVSSAEVPLRRTNTLLQEFKTTLANTARWQISSSILHGFMGSIQTAYHYAQDLNESLNNIRIVTGQSTDQMAEFAKTANESAKALSTTTTEYTDAALIFYQQGLNDEQVKERTDVTIKMANVSRQSAEEVSDQMTAVWNNFNKSGDESAEHFADVMTKLGAETASSSSEIATGLEKFAGIANTIGLSFDYASSALATITATSRETPEVVGTALKTIFARIQGLKLGETLEDGTDLNKYSEGLAKVGISIKDASGEMKAADVIIDEMGAKWKQLSKDQQMALAQTVAGTRQYNQLVTLMDNFDFFEENVGRAQDSEGTLQEQADIYAESWEAARDRVKASLESVYNDLLSDDFFIGLTNVTAKVIDGLDNMIKTMGGIPGVVSNLGNVFLTVFKKDIASAIDSAKYNLELFSEKGRNAIIERRKSFNNELVEMSATSAESEGFEGLPDLYREQGAAQNELIEKKVQLEAVNAEINEQDQIALQLLEQQTNALIEQYKIKSQNVKNAKENVTEATTNAIVDIGAKNFNNKGKYQNDEQYQSQLNKAIANEKAFSKILITVNKVKSAFNQGLSTEQISNSLTKLIEQLELSEDEMKDADSSVQKLWERFKSLKDNPAPEEINKIIRSLQNLKNNSYIMDTESISHMIKEIEKVGGPGSKQAINTLRQLQQEIKQESSALVEQGQAMNDATTKIEAYKQKIQEAQKQYATFGQKAVGVAQGISTISMAISSLAGIWNTLNNDDMSWGEKILSVLTSLGFVIPNIISGVKGIRDVLLATSVAEKIVAADGTIMWAAILGPIAIVIAAIPAVAAAIAGVVAVYKDAQKMSPEAKLKDAKESAEKAAESLKNIKTETENIISKIEDLESAVNVFNKLTKGTEEWQEQMTKITTQVTELLQLYPELSNYIDFSNGSYVITKEGLDQIKQVQEERLSIATDISFNAQRSVNQAQYNKNINDFQKFEGATGNQKELAQLATEVYRAYGNTPEAAKQLAQLANPQVSDTNFLDKQAELFKEYINSNERLIQQNISLTHSNEVLANTQLQKQGSEIGSVRNGQQLLDLLGINDYTSIVEETNKKLRKDFGAWNDDIDFDYNENGTDEKSRQINEFLKYQGGNAKYIGQDEGNLIYQKEGGEEVSVSQKDFFDTVTAIETSDSFKEKIRDKIQESLQAALGDTNIDLSKLSDKNLTGLDNLFIKIQEHVEDKDLATNLFKNYVSNFSSEIIQEQNNDINSQAQAIENLSDKLSSINWSSTQDVREFNQAIQELVADPSKIQDFTHEIEHLAAAGNLEKQTSKFQSAVKELGLSEEDADIMKEHARNLMDLAESSEELSDKLYVDDEAASDLAIEIAAMNKGIEDLAEGWEEWSSVLRDSSKESQEYAEASYKVKDALGNILGIEGDLLSSNFINEHLEEIGKAAEGDADAIDHLRSLMGEEIIQKVSVGLDTETQQKITDIDNTIHSMIDGLPPLEIEAKLNSQEFLDAANQLVQSAQMTADEANAYFADIGYEPVYNETEVEGNAQMPNAMTTTEVVDIGFSDSNLSIGEANIPIKMPKISTKTYSEPLPPSEAEGGMKLISISGSDKVKAPIKGFRKKASGSSSNYSSKNSGGKSPGGKTGNSGGGSKQSKQPQTKDHKEPIKDLADRYHDLNKAIQDVEHSMSMLSKTQSHLKGAALVKSLKEQNKLLEQQKSNYQALNNELRKEQGELQWILSFAGGSFGADGSILNYTEVFNNIKAEYNRAVDAYNGVIDWFNSLSGEQQDEMGKTAVENAEKTLNTAKQTYDDANKYLKRYDEVYNELQKNDEKLKDLLYEQIENNLKAFEVEIQVKLDISEAQRKINDFLRDVNKNFKTVYTTTKDWVKLFNTAIKNAKSFTGATGTINTRLREIQEVRNIIDNPNYDYNSGNSLFADRTEAVEKLKEYTDELMSEAKDLYDLYEDTWNSYLDAMDESLDQWNDILSGFEEINDTLDHYQKIAEMLYGGEDVAKGRELLNNIYSTSSANSLATQSMLRQQIASLTKEYQDLVSAGAKEGDEDLKKVQDAIKDANKNLQSEIENYLDVIQNKLTNSIKSIMDTADKALTKGFGINKVNERWSDAKEAVEGYYDEVEKVYQLESLESKWEKAINDTSTIKNQQYLKALMDGQLSNLRAKTKLSEYDIQLAEKELAIYQAQMALEDARNNKNTMKLTRNEQGDWTYQYVADEDDIASKEEELLNALYEKYEFVKQSSAEAMEAILNMKATADEKLSELMEQYKVADEERRAELAEEYEYWYSYYYGEDGLIVQKVAETQTMETDLQTAGMETLWGLYETDQNNFDLMTQNEKDLITSLTDHGVDSLKTLELGRDDFYTETQDQTRTVIADTRTQWQNLIIELIKSWNTDKNSVRANVQDAYAKMMQAVAEYDAAIVRSEQASGVEWSKVNQQLQGTRNEIQQVASKIDEVIAKTDGLDAFRLKVSELENQWYGVKGAIEEAIYSLESYLNILTSGEYGSHYDYGSGPGHSGGSGDSGGGDAGWGGGGVNEEAAYGIAQNIWTYGSWGNDPVRRGRIIERYGEETANRAQEIVNEKVRNGTADELINWDSDKWAFATGGYTGEWGKEGRLALLHQKELVLNEEDTKNILDTVNVVRSIKDSISNMVAGVTGLKPSVTTAASVSNNDNKVFNITAEFPNANSVTEIQEAILGLPNLASQWMSANA